jgi:repressor LexA
MRPLTSKQQAVFDFIVEYYREHYSVPNYPTIQDEFNLKSSNSVYQYLEALKEKGYLEKVPYGYRLHESKHELVRKQEELAIPIRGRLTPDGTVEEIAMDQLPVAFVMKRSPELFALKVVGNSMVGADIRHGDYIILEQKEVTQSDTWLMKYNGGLLLSRMMKTGDNIVLLPESPARDTLHINQEELEEIHIFGAFVGKAWQEDHKWHIVF